MDNQLNHEIDKKHTIGFNGDGRVYDCSCSKWIDNVKWRKGSIVDIYFSNLSLESNNYIIILNKNEKIIEKTIDSNQKYLLGISLRFRDSKLTMLEYDSETPNL